MRSPACNSPLMIIRSSSSATREERVSARRFFRCTSRSLFFIVQLSQNPALPSRPWHLAVATPVWELAAFVDALLARNRRRVLEIQAWPRHDRAAPSLPAHRLAHLASL